MLDKLHQERPCRLAGLCGQALAHKSVSGFSAPVRAPCCVAMVRVFFSLAAYDSAMDFGLEICTHVQPAGARACPELFAGAGGPDEGHDQRASTVQARWRPKRLLLKRRDCVRGLCRKLSVVCWFASWASPSHTDCAVMQGVGQHVDLRVTPIYKLAVKPDESVAIGHGHGCTPRLPDFRTFDSSRKACLGRSVD